jgi:hypothetical protein
MSPHELFSLKLHSCRETIPFILGYSSRNLPWGSIRRSLCLASPHFRANVVFATISPPSVTSYTRFFGHRFTTSTTHHVFFPPSPADITIVDSFARGGSWTPGENLSDVEYADLLGSSI